MQKPPNTRMIVGGVDLTDRFGVWFTDDYTLGTPSIEDSYITPKGSTRGQIYLDETVFGDVSYGTREQTFTFVLPYPKDWEFIKKQMMNFLHGREFDYWFTFDPDYTYHGKFQVDEHYTEYHIGYVKLNVTAEPFKTKKQNIYQLNGAGGAMYIFESGRMPTRPQVECATPTIFTFNGETTEVGAGSWYLNNVLFTEGENKLYINSLQTFTTEWDYFAQSGTGAITWDGANEYRWDAFANAYDDEGEKRERSKVNTWAELLPLYTWDRIKAQDKAWTWYNYKPAYAVDIDTTVYLTYDWKDL